MHILVSTVYIANISSNTETCKLSVNTPLLRYDGDEQGEGEPSGKRVPISPELAVSEPPEELVEIQCEPNPQV